MKSNLFLDFDGTVVCTIKSIVDLYNQDFKYYKNFKPIEWSDIETWGFTECNCATSDYINTYFNQERFYDILEYQENAKEILDELKKHFNIKIVSMGYSPNLKGKEIWIKKNMPYAEFIGVNFKDYEDKAHIDMSGGILIDDSANNLITSNSDVKICYGDFYEWNKNWTGKRCFNWYEVREYLMNIIST